MKLGVSLLIIRRLPFFVNSFSVLQFLEDERIKVSVQLSDVNR